MPISLMPRTLQTAADRPARTGAATVGDTPDLEIALLRRGIGGRSEDGDRCGRCERHMLIGERVYEYGSGEVRCALCSERERRAPEGSHLVHTPAFGSSFRVLDTRAA
jgi:hypothetical protein